MFSKKAVFLGIALSLFAGIAHAADKALILGVGDYANEDVNDLNGIDIDVEMMVSAAQLMGFESQNILVLEDDKATFKNIADAMLLWMNKDLSPDDRVLIYFSGHGTSFEDSTGGEESDQKDEILVLHDAYIKKEYNGVKTFGLLFDDLFGKLLDKVASNNVMVFIDACHSGTPTRSLTQAPTYFGDAEVYPKYVISRPGAPGVGVRVSLPDVGTRDLESKAATDRFVVMSAARDNESAIATSRGSIFTTSVYRSIRNAIQANRKITPEQIINDARAFVRASVPPEKLFIPQLSGNESRFNRPLATASLANGAAATPGTRWTKLSGTADELIRKHGALQMQTNATDYRIGQPVEVSINVPAAGYLNVVTVDSQDNSTVLFPNRYHKDNQVQAGNLRIPTSQMDFTLPASEPAGQTLVVAFLSDRPINFFESQVGGERDADGKFLGDFAEVSPVATRAISVAPKQRPSSWVRANKLVVSTRN